MTLMVQRLRVLAVASILNFNRTAYDRRLSNKYPNTKERAEDNEKKFCIVFVSGLYLALPYKLCISESIAF